MPDINPYDAVPEHWEEFKEAIQTKNPCKEELPFPPSAPIYSNEDLMHEIKSLREEVREQNRRLSRIEFMLSLNKEEKAIWNIIAKSRSFCHDKI